jgi:Peroxidase
MSPGVGEQIRDALRGTAAESFSVADIIALAPAYGLSKLGGGSYDLLVGRVDALSADADIDEALPEAGDKLEDLKAVVGKSGFSMRETVVLSAHTRCAPLATALPGGRAAIALVPMVGCALGHCIQQ